MSGCSRCCRCYARMPSTSSAECVLAAVSHVQKVVLVLVFVIHLLQWRIGGCQGALANKQEDRLLGRELDPLADNVLKLTDREVVWNEEFFLRRRREIKSVTQRRAEEMSQVETSSGRRLADLVDARHACIATALVNDYGDAVWVLRTDALRRRLARL